MSNWIECGERMPEFREDVLAVDSYGDVGIGYFYEGYQGNCALQITAILFACRLTGSHCPSRQPRRLINEQA